ncbi:MAG: arginine--tRNA ligase [Chloroflexi bacterium]|nr:arginine--tRNA ligase [Chloroflexota bacterium]
MDSLLKSHALLIESAVYAAQSAGDLPQFTLPTIEIKPPSRPEMGDYAYAGALAVSKVLGMKPIDIATAIAKHLKKPDFLSSIEVVPPGFVNFRLNSDWLRTQIDGIIAAGDSFGSIQIGTGKRAQVEFVSANPTGPLHIGRSRGAIVGDTIARILEAAGYTVEREYYFNNAGTQMLYLGTSMRLRYLEALGEAVEMPAAQDETFYQGQYLVDFARDLVAEIGDAWKSMDWKPFKEYVEKRMFNVIKATLERVNIRHDYFFNENSLYETEAVWETLSALESIDAIYSSPYRDTADDEEKAKKANMPSAKWFRSTRFGDVEDRVVLRSDGSPTYTLPDIAYHMEKLSRGFDLLVNILGADHDTEHKVVKYGVGALGGDTSKIHVIILQFVRLIRQGKEVKMSTRRGNYETLDDLIDQTSADAVRYMLLARNANSRLDFDLDLAVAQSSDNPVYYIQYAYVRTLGILREAELRGVSDDGADLSILGAEELGFIKRCLTLGDEILLSVAALEPHRIAFYAHELASAFHPMYDRVRVFGEGVEPEVSRARLRFYRATQTVFKRVLGLMGMSTPERM